MWADYPVAAAAGLPGLGRAYEFLARRAWDDLLVTDARATFLYMFNDHGIAYAAGDGLARFIEFYGTRAVLVD